MRTGRNEKLSSVFALAIAAAMGCGDDVGVADSAMPPSDTGTGGDTLPDAGDSAIIDSGSDDTAVDSGMPPGCTEATLDHLLVVTTAADFSRSGLGAVALGDSSATAAPDDLPETDSVVAVAECVGYVLSRGLGIVSSMDTADPLVVDHTIAIDPAGAMGPYASNPQTLVAVAPNKGYVVVQARNAVTIIDPTMMGTGAVLDEIDLSPYVKPGDTDGLVDALDAIVIGDRLFVALGNYWFDSSFAIQFEGSEIAVIDTSTDSLVDVDPVADGIQGIDLMGENPWRGLHHDAATNMLWVASSGDSFAIDGMIETIDLATLTSSGSVVSETQLMKEINAFGVVSPTRVVILAGTDLVAIDPSLDFTDPAPFAGEMDGMLLHRGTIWAWARGGAEPGLASFDAVSGTETSPASGRLGFADLPVFDVVPVP